MRKSRAKDRILLPDPKFGDQLITRFVNNMMVDGKKTKAFSIFYGAMEIVDKKIEEVDPVEAFKKGLANVTPQVEVRSRRVGGATFQIPQPVRDSRKIALGIKWMILNARKRNGKGMEQKLADEIISAFKEEGGAFKKKEDTHRMAEANKAFSHFRF
ncbi:MAG: 30S ribosomal protein S7 [Flavobacteriales bacterium]|jgi:small subunit ribosomal protein S7|nr:30S ribosomal protein S7 [Flavobacteriales bacterium]